MLAQVVKNLPANPEDIRDAGSAPGSGRFPGGEPGNPLQNSCLENPTDREDWRATVHGVTKSQTEVKQLSTHIHKHKIESTFMIFGEHKIDLSI